jgi:surface polysaccharide O-acyltransferase-like enzyme
MLVGRPTETRWVTWIDAARVAAILAVISIHVVTSLVTARSHPDSWWFGNVVSSASRWCVPLFVMLSGTLLLQSGREEGLRSFYQRRLARIGLPLVVWTLVYLWVGHLRTDHPADLGEAVSLTLAGLPYYHMYFVYLIAGLYLVTPFLRPLAAVGNSRLLAAGAALFLAIGMLDLAIRVWGGHGGVNAVTRFVPYIGYFLAGAWRLI